MSSKLPGSSRIPTFGTRIPQAGRPKSKDSQGINARDIGKRVLVADKIGTLRYVGPVQFAKHGEWCGIELDSAIGKHDGCINGTRYFTCSKRYGLMTPLSKVTLLDQIEDATSGPYSMLFISQTNTTTQRSAASNNANLNHRNLQDTNRTVTKTNLYPRPQSSSCTDVNNVSNEPYDATFAVTQPEGFGSVENLASHTFTADIPDNVNSTYNKNLMLNDNVPQNVNEASTFVIGNGETSESAIKIDPNILPNKRKIVSDQATSLNATVTFEGPGTSRALDNEQGSDIQDQLNCTIRKEHKSDYESKQVKKSYENLFSDFSVKRRRLGRISSLVASSSDEKPIWSPVAFNLKFDYDSQSSPIVNITRKVSSNEDDNKRDSLEFEESLGILTPTQLDAFSLIGTVDNPKSIFNQFEETNFIDKTLTSTDAICTSDDKTPITANTQSQQLYLDKLTGHSLREVTKEKSFSQPNLTSTPVSSDDVQYTAGHFRSELPSPNLPSTEFSYGLLDDQVLQNITIKSDTTVNMELPLDTADKSKNYQFTRLEQTPSPEDLPLDPTPIVEIDLKIEPVKSKTNSFITSITSITSLDTGYQGDGEMSRPASRNGTDNSPLTRRPSQRPQPRRPDPMTDSDFYTESDADNHDDNHLRGDRKAQVIDGTLYGVDPQAAADIYVNNRENMDSSGIFTDIESNTRAEDLTVEPNPDVSPSDTSTKTISDNSQDNLHEIVSKSLIITDTKQDVATHLKDNPKKRNAPSPVVSSSSSITSPRHVKKDDSAKKYKTLKRDVQSKVKTFADKTDVQKQVDVKTLKKTVGRWDAVMDKISKNDQTKTNLKEVKSRVFNNVNTKMPGELKKVNSLRQIVSPKTPTSKIRRTRLRTAPSTPPSLRTGSPQSSISDLSNSISPPKKSVGSAKKRDVLVTQVLTPSKLTSKGPFTPTVTESKRQFGTPTSSAGSKVAKNIFTPKDKKQISNKECGRGVTKGGRASPAVRSPAQTRVPTKPAPKTAEALAVLVQHLVFNVEAFKAPCLRKQVEKLQLEAGRIRSAYQRLEELIADERQEHSTTIEEEKDRYRKEISDLLEKHNNQIFQLTTHNAKIELRLLEELEKGKQQQTQHHESVDILREENEAIREEIDEKNAKIREARHESLKLKKDYEAKGCHQREQMRSLHKDVAGYKERLRKMEEENAILLEENRRLLGYGEGSGISIQEIESLRAILDLKQTEVVELRRSLAEATQKADYLASCEEKASVLTAKCEDLQLQLQRKIDNELMLQSENKKLEETCREESNHKRRLSQYNEELQWKLKQNKEVVTKILEHRDDSFNRTGANSSFSERHHSTSSLRPSLDRTLSLRDRFYSLAGQPRSHVNDEDDVSLSPPSSPKIKAVVEKQDSVSYVLDLNESPEVVASRIVRRSFRNPTPPKSTPNKSPSNKRPRIKNSPLSLSSSASSIISSNRSEYSRSRSISVRHEEFDNMDQEEAFIYFSSTTSTPRHDNVKLDESYESCNSGVIVAEDASDLYDHEVDLKLPALPSEMGCKKGGCQALLPSPKHLAGESAISDSFSEDESTSSSSGQL